VAKKTAAVEGLRGAALSLPTGTHPSGAWAQTKSRHASRWASQEVKSVSFGRATDWRVDGGPNGGTLHPAKLSGVAGYTTPVDIQDARNLAELGSFCRRMGREARQG
jgi:hypothetical protein